MRSSNAFTKEETERRRGEVVVKRAGAGEE